MMKLFHGLFCDRLTGLYDRPIIVCVVCVLQLGINYGHI